MELLYAEAGPPNPSLEGQILQFGFENVNRGYDTSGVNYDNVNFTLTQQVSIPVPAIAIAGLAGLLGLVGVAGARKRKSA